MFVSLRTKLNWAKKNWSFDWICFCWIFFSGLYHDKSLSKPTIWDNVFHLFPASNMQMQVFQGVTEKLFVWGPKKRVMLAFSKINRPMIHGKCLSWNEGSTGLSRRTIGLSGSLHGMLGSLNRRFFKHLFEKESFDKSLLGGSSQLVSS